jgi:hypothetical protein
MEATRRRRKSLDLIHRTMSDFAIHRTADTIGKRLAKLAAKT